MDAQVKAAHNEDRQMPDKAEDKSGERIAKVMARAGLCSRREAEAWIAAGRVSVNGAVITSPALNIGPRDRVAVDGNPLPVRERTRLFLYNKPAGLVTTHADPQGRPTIFGALPKDLPRLISVGRLDLNTEGLLLLTNDGGLARVLELPATGWLRRYRVRAFGAVTQEALAGLRAGVEVEGVRYGSIEATLDRAQGSNVWLTFAIREGKNREIRNVLRHLGLHVNRLIRVSFGPFQLGELGDGEIEEVRGRVVREQIGERVEKLAGADFSGPIVAREGKPRSHAPDVEPLTGEGEKKVKHRRGPRQHRPRPALGSEESRGERHSLRRPKFAALPNPPPQGGRERAKQAAPRVTQSVDQRHKRNSAQRSRDQKTPSPGKTAPAPAFPPALRGRDSEGGKLRSPQEAKRSRPHPRRGKTKR
jgi:23S rRNA pseudouridine2605 synthase